MKKFIGFFIFICSVHLIYAGDTITIMHYNLLNYGNYTSDCTSTNNNIDLKDGYLQSIINYIKPDVFCVNEIGSSTTYHSRILNNVLNINGINYYRRVTTTNYANSYIVNMLYYNNNKLGFLSSAVANTVLRDINIFKFYYKSTDLASGGDTAYITFILTHLKAGSDSASATQRTTMVTNLMNYLNNIGTQENYVLTGDFNVYRSTETCFQLLVNHPNSNIRFYDPINKLGIWNNNSYYAPYHTQSTNTDGSNTCKSSGGMDDRFDFIMLSGKIINGLDKVRYINNSYWAIGNDGNHFNQSINYGTNNSVPANVLSALAGMSDHLPVRCKLYVDKPAAIIDNVNENKIEFVVLNPVADQIKITFEYALNEAFSIQLFDVTGQLITENYYPSNNNFSSISIDANHLPTGLFFVKINVQGKVAATAKVIKL